MESLNHLVPELSAIFSVKETESDLRAVSFFSKRPLLHPVRRALQHGVSAYDEKYSEGGDRSSLLVFFIYGTKCVGKPTNLSLKFLIFKMATELFTSK